MKLQSNQAKKWLGWETPLAFSMYGTSLRVLPIGYEFTWLLVLSSFFLSILWFIFDITLHKPLIKKKLLYFLFLYLLLISFILLTLLWSPINASELVNSDIFLFTNFIIPTILLLLNLKPGAEKRWISGVIIACGSVSTYVFFIWVNTSNSLYLIFSTSSADHSIYTANVYLNVAQSVMTICIISLIWSIYSKKRKKLNFSIFLITLWMVMELGARGPLIWGILSFTLLGVFFIITHKNYHAKIIKTIAFLVFLAPLALIILNYISTNDWILSKLSFVSRFLDDAELGYDSNLSSIGARLSLRDMALSTIMENPLIGYGVFSFRSIAGKLYSHNLFLDIWFELGLVGLLLLGIIIYKGIDSCLFTMKRSNSPEKIAILALFLYILGMSMTSGYFYWNSLIPFTVLASFTTVWVKKSKLLKNNHAD